jgi:putative SOS response-associated peptidase YedK
MATWGLIPGWIKGETEADRIRFKTLNARSETVFEKPSFRHAVRENRCLIPVSGFFEFREVNDRKYPYHIRMKDGRIFSLAGIFEDWDDPSGRVIRTFSIVTAEANPLMAKIHNTKMRMPVILSLRDEGRWIDPLTDTDDLKEMMAPYEGKDLEAYPVSLDLSRKGSDTNLPFILDMVDHPELRFRDLDSFL